MTVEPLLGHGAVLARLYGAFERQRLHHALLIEGPMGVGKRQLAERLALSVNCQNPPGPAEYCGECGACRPILAGRHPDVIRVEPDTSRAARSIPVEAIREVIRQSQYHRYSARHRFVIVDPAEAMQEPAANALLKTLEEPPDGTGFLVITHNAKALLPTIMSRCQRVRLGTVPTDEIETWLKGRGISHAAVAARWAQGCPGRALTLAGTDPAQQIAQRDALIAVIDGPFPDVFDFAERLTKGTRQAWAPKVERLLEIGEELLRDTAVVATGEPVEMVHADLRDQLSAWADRLWPNGVGRLANAIQALRDDLEVFVSGKLALAALLTAFRRELGRPH
ncbi:MAG: DNA polymerase III subunit delta' [Myxococcota bacterium]